MIRTLIVRSLLVLLVAVCMTQLAAADWFYMPSTYSHSPATGARVRQYAPIPPVIIYNQAGFVRSGYRQSRSTIRAGGSLDNYHIVEQFGDQIRPYGEWLYPNRPYAVPYDIWGPPFGGVNGEFYGDAAVRGGRGFDDRRRVYDDRFRNDRGFRDRDDDGRFRDDRRFDARSREYERYNGLFDGRGIPGDDEHYLDHPSRLDLQDDREFYYRGRARP